MVEPSVGDAAEYVAMADGTSPGRAPFAKRIGVPFVARHLPTDARSALAAHAQNPWLVDTSYLLVQQLVLLALALGAATVVVLLLAAGAFVRENATLLGFAPLVADWVVRRRPTRLAMAAPAAGVVIAVFLEVTRGSGAASLTFKEPGLLVGDLFGAWHGLWLFVVLGARRAFLARQAWVSVVVAVLLPALLSSLVATDTSRLLFLAFPAVAACVAFELPLLSARGLRLVMLAVPFLAVGTLASVTTIATPSVLAVRQTALLVGAGLLVAARVITRPTTESTPS